MRQKEFFGLDSLKKINGYLLPFKAKKIFLVTGGNSYTLSGAKKIIDSKLKEYQITHFNNFEANPKIKDIQIGISAFKKTQPDIVLAIGGGSVIDVAKSVNCLAANPGPIVDYVRGKSLQFAGKPLIAVPLTSGSGSEATSFAVVYIGKTKYSLTHHSILPQVAIVDPKLTYSLSSYQTATSGLDALCQAIESYWSTNSTTVSKRYSAQAIKLIVSNLEASITKPTKSSREAMSQGSHLAGKAINIAKTTASHAISYPITSFFGIPHGHAVALTISSLFLFNAHISPNNCQDKRGDIYVKKTMKRLSSLIIGRPSIAKAASKLDSIISAIGIESRLSKLAIDTKGIELIIQNGFNPERIKNNPRQLTKGDLREILAKLQ